MLPALQGQGIGTSLLAAAVTDMVEAGASKLVVATIAGSAAEKYYLGTGAHPLFETSNEYFGKPNRVCFLGWEIDSLKGELDCRIKRILGA